MYSRSKFSALLVAMSVGVTACASQSTYIPEERATATLGGRTAASYQLPSEGNEQGHVRVASYGTAKVKGDGSKRAIHLRLAISDSGAEPVVLNTTQQRLQLPNGRQLAPSHAVATSGTLPMLTIQPGTTETVDLYFDVPESSVPGRFDVIWRLRLGDQDVSRITPFDKVDIDPAVARQEAAEELMYWEPRYGYGFYHGW